jgi:copper homeostasis protein
MKRLEIACFNLESALIAAKAGADRIEFCADYASGGTTPKLEDFITIKKATAIPVYVMIRPRGGDFMYSAEEISSMNKSITDFVEAGADGLVFGVLNSDKTLSVVNEELVVLAGSTPCTFHRAFDHTPVLSESLEQLINWGFKTVLTSGGSTSAMAGAATLQKLLNQANGRIQILPGGSIRSSNIAELAKLLPADFFHSAGITDGFEIADLEEIKAIKSTLAS